MACSIARQWCTVNLVTFTRFAKPPNENHHHIKPCIQYIQFVKVLLIKICTPHSSKIFPIKLLHYIVDSSLLYGKQLYPEASYLK